MSPIARPAQTGTVLVAVKAATHGLRPALTATAHGAASNLQVRAKKRFPVKQRN
jgi:hypothetical protein